MHIALAAGNPANYVVLDVSTCFNVFIIDAYCYFVCQNVKTITICPTVHCSLFNVRYSFGRSKAHYVRCIFKRQRHTERENVHGDCSAHNGLFAILLNVSHVYIF